MRTTNSRSVTRSPGRRALPPDQKLSKHVAVLFTQSEWEVLADYADERNVSLGEALRQCWRQVAPQAVGASQESASA